MGRWVYGEVPALAFRFLASFLWFSSVQKDNLTSLIWASLCFGLATLTKDLISFGLIGSLLAVYVIDRLFFNTLRLRQVMIPLFFSIATIVIWQILTSSLAGETDAPTGSFIERASIRLLVFAPHLWFDNSKFLVQEGFVLWSAPALVYTFFIAFSCRDRRNASRQLLFPIFVLGWMSWYVIASIGWPRYAYPGWAISTILVAKFLYDLVKMFKIEWPTSIISSQPGQTLARFSKLPVLALIAILIFWPAQNTLRRIVKGNNQTATEFATYIDANLPENVLIASEEWEIDFLTRRTYLHHPMKDHDLFIKHLQLGYPLEDYFDISIHNPDYIVQGPYNRGVGYIPKDFIESQGNLIVSIGDYELYQIKDKRSWLHY
jgi:hypothetical protein